MDENYVANKDDVFRDALMADHDDDDYETTIEPHAAAHNFLSRHMDELRLLDGANLLHGPEPAKTIETDRAIRVAYDPTELGELFLGALCSLTTMWPKRFTAIGIGGSPGEGMAPAFLVPPEDLAPYLTDVLLMGMRLALAHRDGLLEDFYKSRLTALPEKLRWVLPPDNPQEEEDHE